MHRFAAPAARAAECAHEAGRLLPWIRTVYAQQDSLGLKTWGALAADAGLPDTALIGKCAMDLSRNGPIDAGTSMGDSAGVGFTPTIVVNGRRLSEVPSAVELRKIVDSTISAAKTSN